MVLRVGLCLNRDIMLKHIHLVELYGSQADHQRIVSGSHVDCDSYG